LNQPALKQNRSTHLADRLLVTLIAISALATVAQAGEFHRLSGTQIRALVVGKRVTDDTHWSQTLAPGGRLLVRDMGHPSIGSWQIKRDQLCISRPGVLEDCYEVWLAGDAIQLRNQSAAMPLTVFLHPATTP
jgi:hypothetical protein